MKILLHGASFANNFGDVLFFEVFYKYAIKNNATIILVNPHPNIKNKLKNIIVTNSVKDAVKQSDKIIYIGGGYFAEQPNKSFYRRFRWGLSNIKNIQLPALFGNLYGKDVYFIGVGAGEVSNWLTRKVIAKNCNNSKKVIVRDEQSKEYLKKYGVNPSKIDVTTDTICSIDSIMNIKVNDIHNNVKKKLLLHLSEPIENSQISKQIVDQVEMFLKKNENYEVVPITDHNGLQAEAAKSINNFFNNKTYPYFYTDTNDLINYINNSDVVITKKLHVGIVASAFEKSVISIPNHNKAKNFYNQIGYPERVIEENGLIDNKLFQLLEKVHDKPVKISNKLKYLALENIEFFEEIIK